MRHPPDVTFLDECRLLSIPARATLAALVLERYCAEKVLLTADLQALLDHHWAWLDVAVQRRELADWERARPPGRAPAAGGNPTASLIVRLWDRVDRTLCASFHGAPEDDVTLDELRAVVAATRLSVLPPVTPFKFSLFSDGGWGARLTPADCDYWRSLRSSYARAV
jgi:hypothetical protein